MSSRSFAASRHRDSVAIVLPALDEAGNIGHLVQALAREGLTSIVVDNGSTDGTAQVAMDAGARVVHEPVAGYGRACRAGLDVALASGFAIIGFMDADGSDPPEEVPRLLAALEDADVALGIRPVASAGWRAMPPAQKFGNWFAPALLRVLVGARYVDMPSMKLFRRDALVRLDPRDRSFGFTIELLVGAHRLGLRVAEIAIDYRPRRSGASKVSGDLRASVKAGVRILSVVGRYAWRARRNRP